ncbi:MAG: aminodeoxychorismate synthase component I [Balneolaceae bacterium]
MQNSHIYGKKKFLAHVEALSEQTPMLLLESQQEGHSSNQYSWLAADPKVEITAFGNRITTKAAGLKERVGSGNPWQAFREIRKKYPGWYFGYFGYDLKNFTENLYSNNSDLCKTPDMYFFQPERLLRYHHLTGMIDPIKGRWGELQESVEIPDFRLGKIEQATRREDYLSRIKQAQERIREGEFYEINLTHSLYSIFEGSPFALYQAMKRKGPVPFGAFLSADGYAVSCASPERFLCKRGERVFSQPIKGTAARHSDPKKDRLTQKNLIDSEKDRAENLMIVDLVRHDISRVAKPGSVRVPVLFELQSFETVHQLISTIEGEVVRDTDPVDILKNCFPMGSMTGAPKISAMETIEELEDYKRGIYSGAIGYISPDHDFDFNVVIRSAILSDNRLVYPVGGAITSGSDPKDEWEETLVKARALPGFSI